MKKSILLILLGTMIVGGAVYAVTYTDLTPTKEASTKIIQKEFTQTSTINVEGVINNFVGCTEVLERDVDACNGLLDDVIAANSDLTLSIGVPKKVELVEVK